jgi:hypothetical protein
VQQEEAIQAKQPNEWSGDQRVEVRLAEVEPIVPRVRRSCQRHVRKGVTRSQLDRLSAFQEDTLGAGMIETREPLQITALERQVAVVGRAQRHRDVGRLVAFDAVPRSNDIDGDRERGRHDEQHQADDAGASMSRGLEGGGRRREFGVDVAHHHKTSEVRKARSASRTPRRWVGRETSWRSG